ncbi:MAG: HNH endonuclease [Bacteroidales bacterium]|nr:HNH endonuclease [Bacteroidales bacterium]
MDHEIRLAAFEWLKNQVELHGDVLDYRLLYEGFNYKGNRISFIGPQGIWKPKAMELPISFTSIPDGPYADSFSKDGFLQYKYMGNDPNHGVNFRLRETWKRQIPLIYFYRVVPGKYLAIWPVYIIGDNPKDLTFTVAVDDIDYIQKRQQFMAADDTEDNARRAYLTVSMKQRVHQRAFREKVLRAYQGQCALCKLKHAELLDAAHIIPDSEEGGEPIVSNGLSLCKIHHAAFDKHILGITPDYTIKLREDILREIDGPMLKYGLQALENNKIILPSHINDRPDRDRLERRYLEFLDAS